MPATNAPRDIGKTPDDHERPEPESGVLEHADEIARSAADSGAPGAGSAGSPDHLRSKGLLNSPSDKSLLRSSQCEEAQSSCKPSTNQSLLAAAATI